VHKYIN